MYLHLLWYIAGDTSGQVEPLLSSFDEPVPLTAIPANALLNRLDEEENAFIEEYDTDIDTDADSHHRRQQEDEDAKIPLLTSPEVKEIRSHLFWITVHVYACTYFNDCSKFGKIS